MKPLDRLFTKLDTLFKAPAFDEAALPPGFKLGKTHRELLQRRNGGYFYGGALHVFGACREPVFHSLVQWNEPGLWREPYGDACEGLVFFAEDAFGDQFALDAAGKVYEFRAEQGAAEEIADDFDTWLLIAVEAPDELLGRGTFVRWVTQHGHLPHGSQLQAYPPFIFADDPEQVQLDAVEAVENMQFHAALAVQIAEIPAGARMKVEFTEEGINIIPEEGPTDGSEADEAGGEPVATGDGEPGRD
jgi:hypothetical protein